MARDFYKDYNPIFVEHYKTINPDITINIKQSHGGSSKQALSVKNGLEADVVTMNQGSDIELLADSQLVDGKWRQAFANNAIPFTSTIVFLVRDGNPKNVKDWSDLTTKGTDIVIANHALVMVNAARGREQGARGAPQGRSLEAAENPSSCFRG